MQVFALCTAACYSWGGWQSDWKVQLLDKGRHFTGELVGFYVCLQFGLCVKKTYFFVLYIFFFYGNYNTFRLHFSMCIQYMFCKQTSNLLYKHDTAFLEHSKVIKSTAEAVCSTLSIYNWKFLYAEKERGESHPTDACTCVCEFQLELLCSINNSFFPLKVNMVRQKNA